MAESSPTAVRCPGCGTRPADRLGDLVRTGPTLTNVNDLRAIVIA